MIGGMSSGKRFARAFLAAPWLGHIIKGVLIAAAPVFAMGGVDVVKIAASMIIVMLLSAGLLLLVIGIILAGLAVMKRINGFMIGISVIVAALTLAGALDVIPGLIFAIYRYALYAVASLFSPSSFFWGLAGIVLVIIPFLIILIMLFLIAFFLRDGKQWRWALAAFALLPVYSAYGPTWPDNPQDDTCSFGSTPNAKFQEFLQIAQSKIAAGEWAPIKIADGYLATKESEQIFRQRLEEISALAQTDNERLAAMHAAARAMGGRYDSRSGNYWYVIFVTPREFRDVINYRIDVRQLGNYSRLSRWGAFNVLLQRVPLSNDVESPLRINDVDYGGLYGWETVMPLTTRPLIALIPPPRHLCPPSYPESNDQNRGQP